MTPAAKKGKSGGAKRGPGAPGGGAGARAAAGAAAARVPAMRWWLALAAIVAITFLVYIPSLDNGFTNWDDNGYVTDNALLLGSHHFYDFIITPISGNYHPLTMLSLALNYRMSGMNPAPYHWLNLLFHLANTALVFVFLRRLTKDKFWTVAATALFFGIHPMHVESVAWISERKDVLYTFFYLIALILYLRYLETKRWLWLVPVFLAFVLSAASKPAAIVLPLMMLALDWYRRRKFTVTSLLEKVPFVIVSAVGAYTTLLAQVKSGATSIQWHFFDKILFAAYGTVMYVVKFFVPTHLSAIHPYIHYEGSTEWPGTPFYVTFAVLLASIPLLVWLCRKSRVFLFGLLFFFINIVLVLQFATVGQAVMAERYTYVPYIGLVFALAWWLDARPEDAGLPGFLRPAIATVLILLVPISAAVTWARCDVWRNSGTLWNDTIAKYPGVIYEAYAHRGMYYRDDAKNYPAAIADFDRAIRLNPGVARAWNYKGMALAQMGLIDSASVCFDKALSIDPHIPSALSNRGGVRLSHGDLNGAVADFTEAIQRDPRIWGAYTNRALAYGQLGNHEGAIADIRSAIALKPTNPDNHVYVNAIGMELVALGRNAEAANEFAQAVAMTPATDARRASYEVNLARARAAASGTAPAPAPSTAAPKAKP